PLQDLALLTQHLVLALELTQPRPLIARHNVRAFTTIGLVLPQPIRQGLRRAPKLGRELLRRPRTAAQQPHRLLTELRRIRRSRPWHLPLLSRAEPESITVSTRPGQFQPDIFHGRGGLGLLGSGFSSLGRASHC